ncbi:GGDEF domain-containing protein [Massilia sp. S19_KUP03_FR1]|uniref:GGDEF domain-containing protein n=1 Tax=Massilia sp. S19_KUP03_FR1 TaxID=3025503 RepID=UPI002FCDB78E
MPQLASAMDGDFRTELPSELRPALRPGRIGLFVSRDSGRRAAMAAACADLIDTVQLADGPLQAIDVVAARQPHVLVIDLEDFVRDSDGAAMVQLVALRAGGPTLLVCPSERASWLTTLMAHGPCDYALAPITLEALYGQIAAMLEAAGHAECDVSLRGLPGLRSRALSVLAGSDETGQMAAGLCAVLATWPGLVHAAVFTVDTQGQLRLAAQAGPGAIDLAVTLAPALAQSEGNLLGRRSRFPALAAARSGELVLADAVLQAGHLDNAGHSVGTIVGAPIPAIGPGQPLGALSLMFASSAPLAGDALLAIHDIAQGAWLGLRLAEANRETEQLMGQVTLASTIDALTGVANRRHGEALLEKEIRRARRYALPLALISFDIDRFKDINDRYGHPCGDMALRTVAAATHAVLRGTDTLVRSGGEEFQIIATHTCAIDGLKMAEKIRLAIAATPIPGCDRLTVSLGVAQLGEQESADALTVRVNAAVGRAKRAGRNCVELAMT